MWRDTRAALLLFIRSANASDVIDKAVAELRCHACFKREGKPGSDGRVNVVLHQIDDPNREIIVAFLPVVVRDPSPPDVASDALAV